MRKRPIAVLFRLNEQEQPALSGYSTEQYIRSLITGAEIKPRPPGELSEILRQLFNIGTNISQVAKVAHTYERVRPEDMEHILQLIPSNSTLTANCTCDFEYSYILEIVPKDSALAKTNSHNDEAYPVHPTKKKYHIIRIM